MSDIILTKNGEFMVAHAEAQTEEATDFIDGYLPWGGHLIVVDSGRIILRDQDVDQFLEDALAKSFKLTLVNQ